MRWRRLLSGLLAALVIGATTVGAGANAPAADVCAPGAAKWEAPGICEYGCDKASAAFAGATVTWSRLAPGVIVSVCVKAGQDLYSPATGPDGGAFTTPTGKDVSHIVITMTGPNAVSALNFAAEPIPLWMALLAVIGALYIALEVIRALTRRKWK